MMESQASQQVPIADKSNMSSQPSDPFSSQNLFQSLNEATKQQPKPNLGTDDMSEQEKSLMGMIENLAKQLEGMDNDDDEDVDDETLKEAEKMMKGLFGNLMGGSN